MTHQHTEAEKLRRLLDTLKASIQQDWQDLAANGLTLNESLRLRKSVDELSVELAAFIERLDQLKHPE